MPDRVLVTGGSGFVGKNLRVVCPSWTYMDSSQCNLMVYEDCYSLFKSLRPSAIIHLAAKVGGIVSNIKSPADYLAINSMINTNVVRAAAELKIERLLACLSTCAFPDVCKEYPFKEECLHDGPPAKTNLSYGYSKRLLHILCESYSKQHGLNYTTFAPCNLYGPHSDCDSPESHFIGALVKKLYEANNGDEVHLLGNGKPLRQHLFVEDLAVIIPKLLRRHFRESIPLIVAPKENLSIADYANLAAASIGKNVKFVFNESSDSGQYRKDGDNSRLIRMIGDFEFTPFPNGFSKTYKWYKSQRVRSIYG